jgi:putative Holliday junction resolvase
MAEVRCWAEPARVALAAGVFLGFDFGERRVGVAVGQAVTGTATALETIRVTSKEQLWRSVGRLVAEWQPAAFVVGLSHQENGDENPITPLTRRFCRQLEGRFRRPVHTVDETLTTMESRHLFAQQRPRKSAEFVDHKDQLAARLILETWLAEQQRGDVP